MAAAITPGVMGASAVDLGLAGNYAILTKTGITTTGTTTITGNMGVSPIAAGAITGFGLIMDPSNQFSTSSLVTGRIYAANYASPTPSRLTTAVHNMETAYTSAAGQVPPNATELYAGNLGGKTLTPGIYKWSTGVLIPASTALTLDAQGNSNAVWVFQVAGDLTMDSASSMVLINNAKAENVFWQIGGGTGVTMNAGAHAKGNILTAKAIVMKAGATLDGRALAQTAVTLIANTVTVPAGSMAYADFKGTPTNGTAPMTVIFADLSTNTPTKWLWTFGDGDPTNATMQDPVHTYAQAGTYTVSLFANNTRGGNTMTKTGYIKVKNTTVIVGVFRPSIHMFFLKNGTENTSVNWGLSSDKPVSGDWNGDGLSDVGVFRPSAHMFLLKNGTENTSVNWGLSSDIPVSGDWNGDGLSDVGVFRPSAHMWLLKNGTQNTTSRWGQSTDIPVTGDWNGDGLSDVGVFRPSAHMWLLKNGSYLGISHWGRSTDIPVTGDWNRDGRSEVGIFRPSTHTFLLKNGSNLIIINWGLGTDIPVTGKWS